MFLNQKTTVQAQTNSNETLKQIIKQVNLMILHISLDWTYSSFNYLVENKIKSFSCSNFRASTSENYTNRLLEMLEDQFKTTGAES